MGRALAHGWLARGWPEASIAVVDADPRALDVGRRLALPVYESIEALGDVPDVIVFAVKPDHLEAAARACAQWSESGCVFLSIAAGKTLASVRSSLGTRAPVVRAMPNTPAAIGHGVTGLIADARASDAQKELCGELMSAVGAVEWIENEALMDIVTAVSGSGPAYVFLLIECLTEAGIELGLSAKLAARLATATVAGAGAYAQQSSMEAAELRRRVTSPNGTTQAALEVLMGNGELAELVSRAVGAAARRSRELSGEVGS